MATAITSLCDLCGGDDPLVIQRAGHSFCCAGCAQVYTILEESGLIHGDFRSSDLYQASLKMGLIANRSREKQLSIPESAERRESVYRVSGLWCTACGWLIEHALLKEAGVISAEVAFASDLLRVTYCPQYVADGHIDRRVRSLGYGLEPYTAGNRSRSRDSRDLLLRTGLAAFLWMNVMLFSLVVYANYFENVSDWARLTIPPILLVLTTPVIFWSGKPILTAAWAGLRHGVIRMETLVASGVLAAYGYSISQMFLGGKHFYFDTACAIVTLVLTGKALERSAKDRTVEALSLLHHLMPAKARVHTDDRERFVSVETLTPGAAILVKPGEHIPADGIVTEGRSTADESMLTGESAPRPKSEGDAVTAGSINGAGVLTVRVTRAAGESTLAQIVKRVEASLATRTTLERNVDKVARLFVPAVLIVAIAVAGGCHLAGVPLAETLMRAIAVLVIACPCALGIATPLATTAAIGAASRRGILLRDAAVIEAVGRIGVVALDKTGTATEGRFRLHGSWWTPEWAASGPSMVAALESVSEHPLGHTLAESAPWTARPQAVEVFGGCGIRGSIGGLTVAVGSRAWLTPQLNAEAQAQVAAWEQTGLTVVYCEVEDRLAGVLALGDQVRPDAQALVNELRRRRIRTLLLSGDSLAATGRIAQQLGISEFEAEVLPDAKAEVIQRYRQQGLCVAMVGDGINDTLALAAADIGIAMGSGADLAAYTAPVVLMNPSLTGIPATLDLAARTQRIVKQNLFWAFFYNTLGIALAATGVLNPILAAGAMVLSSLSVIGNSMRAARPIQPWNSGGRDGKAPSA